MRHAWSAAVMRSLILGLMTTLSWATAFPADPSPLHARILATEFGRVGRVDRIPASVMSALSPLLAGKRLVDPNHLDKATNMWKPNRADRLLFAASSPTLWLVQYELREPEPKRYLAIVELNGPDHAKAIEQLVMNEPSPSIPVLKRMIQAGEFATVGR